MTTGSIYTFERGVDVVVQWRISHFSTLDESDGTYYYSPAFSIVGERWCLGISPNGCSRRYSSGYVDLWLRRFSSGPSINVSFSLSLETAEGGKYREEHGTKDSDYVKFIHEFNRYIPRTELNRLRSELLPGDVLTVVCTMKGSTSAGRDSHSASAQFSPPVFYSAGCSSNSGEGRHCRGDFTAVSLSSHERKCMQRPVKCPDCLEVVVLQKWFDEHQCQHERPEGEACAPGCSAVPHQNDLHYDLKQLFLNKDDCDVTIRVGSLKFPAHKAIIKARSPVFASIFRHDMKENATGVVEIEDCEPSTFSDFLCYLYCGDVGIISQENVFGLFMAADKYQVSNLRAKCLEFVKQNLSVETFCETLTMALRHSEAELIRLCTDYFKQNVPRIIVTVKWQIFLAENPTESNELLIKSFVPNSS